MKTFLLREIWPASTTASDATRYTLCVQAVGVVSTAGAKCLQVDDGAVKGATPRYLIFENEVRVTGGG
jgi:hypothetical protein